MMGHHTCSESLFYYFRLEDQVPENHLLRLIDTHIDFSFVREQLKASYSDTGRPSIDQSGTVVAYCVDRLSVWDQQRTQAYRRIAYASGVALVHRARFRSGNPISLHVFEESPWAVPRIEVVRADVRTHRGPVFRGGPGARRQAISVDGTFVEANASKESRIPREQLTEAAQVNRTVREWLTELEAQNPVEEPTHSQDKVSTTDPDSTYATKAAHQRGWDTTTTTWWTATVASSSACKRRVPASARNPELPRR